MATTRAGRTAFEPLVWACAAFAGGVLLHVDRTPPWAVAVALALLVWRLATARTGRGAPGIVVRIVLAVVLAAVVLQRFHTLNGLAACCTDYGDDKSARSPKRAVKRQHRAATDVAVRSRH